MDYAALSAEALVRACSQSNDSELWEQFVRRFQPLISATVLKVLRKYGKASRENIENMVQEVYEKTLSDAKSVLRDFESQHADSFYGFLQTITRNHVIDHLKSEGSIKHGGNVVTTDDDAVSTAVDFSSSSLSAAHTERQILIGEIESALCRVAQGPDFARDRKIFWLYYRVGLTAATIASLPSIDLETKGVESAILKLTRKVREELAPAPAQQGKRRR